MPNWKKVIVSGSDASLNSIIVNTTIAIGTSSLGTNENTLVIGPPVLAGTGEGGQILLQASGGLYTSASMLDTYQNRFRILRGTNAGSDAEPFSINLNTGQLTINKYTGSGAFPGTVAANLAIDTSGNILTVAPGTVTSASYALTASYAMNGGGGGTTTGSFTGSFTGSLLGTASYATQALSASYFSGSVLNAVSASYALTASYILSSSPTYSTITQTTTYLETATSGIKIVLCDTTAGAFAVTLPTAVNNTAMITVKKIAGNPSLTVDGNSTETIDGGLTAVLTKINESITLIASGSNWYII